MAVDERWGRYMASREWGLLKRAVKDRADGVCERCRDAAVENVHHLTYVRKYQERLEDLLGLCRPCHEYLHGKSDLDPCASAEMFVPWPSTSCYALLEDTIDRLYGAAMANIIPFLERATVFAWSNDRQGKAKVAVWFPCDASVAFEYLRDPMRWSSVSVQLGRAVRKYGYNPISITLERGR